MEKENVTTKAIHQQLKGIIANEISQLPELLGQLDPKERIKAVLQLMPYVAPKMGDCETTYGEKEEIEFGFIAQKPDNP